MRERAGQFVLGRVLGSLFRVICIALRGGDQQRESTWRRGREVRCATASRNLAKRNPRVGCHRTEERGGTQSEFEAVGRVGSENIQQKNSAKFLGS